jgi:hypothetical protein
MNRRLLRLVEQERYAMPEQRTIVRPLLRLAALRLKQLNAAWSMPKAWLYGMEKGGALPAVEKVSDLTEGGSDRLPSDPLVVG